MAEQNQMPKLHVANLFVNENGYVFADGAKICKITPQGQLEFLNKGHRNSARRGAGVPVNPADLLRLARLAQQSGPGGETAK